MMMDLLEGNLAVEQHGSGDAILFVHGLGGTSNVWHAQRTLLERHFHTICPDLDGSGRTPARGVLSIASFVADMVALLDTLKIRSAHLVGHSMGTIVCQHLAASHGDRVKSMVLLGPLAEPPQAARQALKARADLARREGMRPVADALLAVSTSTETRAHRPVVCAMVREILMRQSVEGYALTCEALANARSAALASIACPTLLITGDEDGVGPPAQTREIAQAISGARMIVLPATGHWTPIERPEEVNRALMNFYFSAGPA